MGPPPGGLVFHRDPRQKTPFPTLDNGPLREMGPPPGGLASHWGPAFDIGNLTLTNGPLREMGPYSTEAGYEFLMRTCVDIGSPRGL